MLEYAEWVTTRPEPPTRTERRAWLGQRFRFSLNENSVRALERRGDFIAYCAELQRGPFEEARAKFLARLPKMVDAYDEALDAARAKQDYSAVARIAEPALDRVLPKRQEAAAATQVNITLSPQQLAGLSTAYLPPEVEVDALPPPPDA